MYKNKKIIAIIPARKGSKRVKEKNGIIIDGKPLFQYSIDVAKKSKYIDDILVSTDSAEWLNQAIRVGCMQVNLRPNSLAQDNSKTIDVLLYEIEANNLKEKYSAIVLLQPTSPYRTKEMLDSAIERYFENNEKSLITITECNEQPIFMRTIENGKLKKIIKQRSDVRSQDFEKIYRIIGNIYINKIFEINEKTILNENEIPYLIDKKFAIDIDTYDDLIKAKEIIKEVNNK